MASLVLNIDVPDMAAGVTFYSAAFGLEVGRRFDDDFIELVGAQARIYLLRKAAGTSIGPAGGDQRRYQRHWTPIHADFLVDDMAAAIRRVTAAGAVQEGDTRQEPYGKLAMFADPFGHGFCLIEFSGAGYDALLPSNPA
ncbi:VOC family protein [Sphingomonas sp. LHG3406-1]|uniref:VOC family protein n=1 Tax=Sphingomonas sp. LHG3406-1 TaxID=2804617 RepID=UPI00262618E9|nr:VOC family protein [Sphingomonas sp. LHG3406-1]